MTIPKAFLKGKLLGFYREDTGEKLLIADELMQALKRETQRRQQAEEQAEQERQRAEQEHQRAEQEHQRAEQERQQREFAQQQLADLENLLARYRDRFGNLPDS
ncbi:hypothetical protein NDI44_17820 [Trichocoleus sp. DQ-A3]|uniref:hypothetical protein n=1 Tax=Coleofasciculus sp. FACHB-125 TaxID=2692784 RepID=UPI0030D72914